MSDPLWKAMIYDPNRPSEHAWAEVDLPTPPVSYNARIITALSKAISELALQQDEVRKVLVSRDDLIEAKDKLFASMKAKLADAEKEIERLRAMTPPMPADEITDPDFEVKP